MVIKHDLPRLTDRMLTEEHPILVSQRTVTQFPLHCHDFFELEVILSGEGTHQRNGVSYPIHPGSAFILRPIDFHRVEADVPLSILNITFNEKALSSQLLYRLARAEGELLQELSGEALSSFLLGAELLKREAALESDQQRGLLHYLLHFFTLPPREGKGEFPSDIRNGIRNDTRNDIRRTLLFMELHFRESLTLEQAASVAGFHPTYFAELFKKETGESFLQRLLSLRLACACALLAEGCSVSYACFESGFGSLSGFFTAFKKRYGISPSEYRKNI